MTFIQMLKRSKSNNLVFQEIRQINQSLMFLHAVQLTAPSFLLIIKVNASCNWLLDTGN